MIQLLLVRTVVFGVIVGMVMWISGINLAWWQAIPFIISVLAANCIIKGITPD